MEAARRRRAVADHGQRALLGVRARFFLTYRLAVRVSQLALAEGAANAWLWRILLAICLAVDIGTWWALRNPDRLGLRVRLVLDSVDIAVWSLGSYTPPLRYDLAVFAGAPLTIDVAMRRPRRALLVPSVTFAVTSVVRWLGGRPFAPLPFTWLILAAVCGVVLSRYDSRLRAQAEEEWSRRRSAEDRRAYVAGQNAVAMGASSVVDGIEGVLPVLGTPAPGSALWQLADGWKTGLGAATRRMWEYLGDALLEWQRDHNRHPDLRSRVVVRAGEGTGTTLLTDRQVSALRRQLSALPPSSGYAVSLDDPSVPHRPPGGAFRLRVGSEFIDVPADHRVGYRSYDPGAVSFALFGLLSLGDVIAMDVPAFPAAACLGLHFAAAWWSHLRVRRLGRNARPAIMVLAVMVAVTVSTVFTVTAQTSHNATGALYPVVPGLDLLAVLLCMYRTTLKERRFLLPVVIAGVVAVPATAWLLHAGSRPLLNLAQAFVWPICAFATAWRYAGELETAVRRHAEDVAVDDYVARSDAFAAGREAVLALARQAVEDAHRRLAELRSELGPTLHDHVRNRLEEVDRRLETLLGGGESSSLTTTSSPSSAMPLG